MNKPIFKIYPYLVFIFAILFINSLYPLATVHAVTEKDLAYMTEEYPPFNFEENGELKGIAVDVLVEIFNRMDSGLTREHIRVFPWARGYKRALGEKNTMLFSTIRTEEREKLFKWVGPVAENRIVVIALKDKPIVIDSAEDLNKYKYGVIRKDIGEQLIVKAGVDKSRIQPGAKVISIIKKMKLNRIDAWAYGESVANWFIKQHGYDPAEFKTVYELMKQGDLYFAFHKDTPDSLIDKFQQALDALKKKDGAEKSEYEKILDRYLK